MIFRFDHFEVNSTSFEVWRDETRLEAQPQVIELLIMLIENRDRVVSREEIFDQIWKNRVVSDTTLSSRIKSLRKLLGDDGVQQKFIRTIHGRGFRFHAEVVETRGSQSESAGDQQPSTAFKLPKTHYARSGNVHIAYQQFGSGPLNLIFVPGFVSNIDNYWAEPGFADWLNGIGRLARVVIFDKRGTGLSDTVAELPDLGIRMDDVRAVMDAVKLDKAFIMGISEGGSLASLFAAMHPDRCNGLILYGAFAKFTSWFATREELLGLFDYIEADWGSGKSIPKFAPSMAEDPDFTEWWGKFERLGATPGAAIALMEMNSQIDITDILPSIHVPALVIHRAEDLLIDVEAGRLLGSAISGAQYIELPGVDHLPWVGNTDLITEAIDKFLHGIDHTAEQNTTLATVLCIEVKFKKPDENQEELQADIFSAIDHYRGLFSGTDLKCVQPTRVYSFDGPARAIYCSLEMLKKFKRFDFECHIGIHIGEIAIGADNNENLSVKTAKELCKLADINQVLVSRTITDLVAGSGIEFAGYGTVHLEALERDWELFHVKTADSFQ
jgi:pimeloyl-ACP methyl ester carboxylesterase